MLKRNRVGARSEPRCTAFSSVTDTVGPGAYFEWNAVRKEIM